MPRLYLLTCRDKIKPRAISPYDDLYRSYYVVMVWLVNDNNM